MFCYKCQQDSYTRLCQVEGICAKDPASVAVEEFLLQGLKLISIYAKKISEYSIVPDCFFETIISVLHASIQNIQVDKSEICKLLEQIEFTKEELKLKHKEIMLQRGFQLDILDSQLYWNVNYSINEVIKQGEKIISKRMNLYNQDELNLISLLMVSLKGIVRNAIQAKYLGIENAEVKRFFYETLFKLTQNLSKQILHELVLESGRINLIAIEDLECGLSARYGNYQNVKVRTSAINGPAILVSGRDIRDLENILKYTESKNINIYTHGEMLLAHTLPELKKFRNLVGHYGGISTDQQLEIESFPGPVVITSNCAWNPPQVFRGRIFTTGSPIWMGVKQIANHNYLPLVNAALDSEGFLANEEEEYSEVGFNLPRFENYANRIKENVASGEISHVFLIVGCSSYDMKREYIEEFIKSVPKDAIIIKFSGLGFSDIPLGEINGIPRILDFGLYNDLVFVLKFFEDAGKVLGKELPPDKFSMVFFLRDQNAVAVLMSIFILGNQNNNIKIDTCTKSMLSPVIFKALEDNFGIKQNGDPKQDVQDFLNLKQG
jgi:hydroxylamine reductase